MREMHNHCSRCENLGVVRVLNEEQQLDSLCSCGCYWANFATVKVWQLPTLNRKIEQAFKVQRCPLVWFLPDNEKGSVPRGELLPSLSRYADQWAVRVRAAQGFWSNWSTIFDDYPGHWMDRY